MILTLPTTSNGYKGFAFNIPTLLLADIVIKGLDDVLNANMLDIVAFVVDKLDDVIKLENDAFDAKILDVVNLEIVALEADKLEDVVYVDIAFKDDKFENVALEEVINDVVAFDDDKFESVALEE